MFSTVKNVRSCLTVLVVLCLMGQPLWSLTEHTVSSGDTLWSIASQSRTAGVGTTRMIKAIKGLNVDDHSSIMNNIVKAGQKLAIPTNAQEVKDGISIYQATRNAHVADTGSRAEQHSGRQEASSRTDSQSSAPGGDSSQQPAPRQSDTQQSGAQQRNRQQAGAREAQLQRENTRLKEAFHQYQNEARAAIERLNDKIRTLERQREGYIAWVIIFVLLSGLVLLFARNRKLKGRLNSAHQQQQSAGTQTEQASASEAEPAHDQTPAAEKNVNDALVEAMIMLEENDIQGAKQCLQNMLNHHPDNIDIRIRLLDVYGAEKDIVSFNSEKDYLAAHLLPADDERWDEIDKVYHQHFVNQ